MSDQEEDAPETFEENPENINGAESDQESNTSEMAEPQTESVSKPPTTSRNRPVITTKVFVGNLPETCRRADILAAFEKFGKVTECDIVRNYAFVHYEHQEDAKAAVAALDDTDFQGGGIKIKVELSVSKVRHRPLMGGKNECYRCGKEGHWSRDCPKGPSRRLPPRGPSRGHPLPPFDPYLDPYYDRDIDPYYRRYPPLPPPDRYRPYGDPYERRRLPPPDPYLRDRDPYTRPPPDYYARRSPPPRDPYYYYERRYPLPPLPSERAAPVRPRVAPSY